MRNIYKPGEDPYVIEVVWKAAYPKQSSRKVQYVRSRNISVPNTIMATGVNAGGSQSPNEIYEKINFEKKK